MENKLTICSFCDKHLDNVATLIVATKSAICNECVELCIDLIEDDKKNLFITNYDKYEDKYG
tara:strand:+ start:69 stop:254 length:186 start_codon:yes stop_codon:yes gene_type:complete